MPEQTLDFTHRFVAGAPGSDDTLLLLHGTGGNEDDLLPLGRALLPGAALLSPRGKVLEHGAPRFFRRLSEGVFDLQDLVARSAELARFVPAAAAGYGFNPRRVYAVGFSNGANIAASLLLLHPEVLAGAVLLRPMVPIVPEQAPSLTGIPVFIAAGRRDPMVTAVQSEALASLLHDYGAAVTLHWQDAGHGISAPEVRAAGAWLAQQVARPS